MMMTTAMTAMSQKQNINSKNNQIIHNFLMKPIINKKNAQANKKMTWQ